MAWTVEYDSKTKVIEMRYTGLLSVTDVKEAIARRISLQNETGTRCVLVDLSRISGSTIGTFDLLSLPAQHFVDSSMDRQSRVAVIMPQGPKEREDARFYETLCLNRGWLYKTFDDHHAAHEWLIAAHNKPDAGDGP